MRWQAFLGLVSLLGQISGLKGLTDSSDVVTSSMTAALDSTVSIGCSDVTENTYVLILEWRCEGTCSSSTANSNIKNNSKGSPFTTLVKFTRGRGVTEQRDPRFQLDQDRFDLNLTSVRIEDAGRYFCLVNNKEASQDVVSLKVMAPTDEPSRPLVTGFTSRSVTLSWTKPRPTEHAPQDILGYVITVNWKLVNEDDNAEFRKSSSPPIFTNSSETRFTLTDLQPYTVYSFQVQAVNSVGKSRPSRQSYPAITLREKPSGKPQVTAAHNISATSVYLEWAPPPANSLHGEFLGYLLSFRPRDASPAAAEERRLADSTLKSYTLEGLSVYTQYLVSLRVYNPEGSGPETIVVVMTDEGAPSAPRNLQIGTVTATTIQLSWYEPARANGVIQGYRLYFRSGNLTSVQSVADNRSSVSETLTNLKPYTRYEVWVRAFTSKHEGKPSEPQVVVYTDVRPPGRPDIVSVVCQSGTTMFLKWTRPTEFYRNVDVYYVFYRGRRQQLGGGGGGRRESEMMMMGEREEEGDWEEQVVETVNNTINHMMYLNNLTTNMAYEVKVRAATRSHVDPDRKLHVGEWSDTNAVFLQPGCEALRDFQPEKNEERILVLNLEEHLGMIAGVICGALGLLLIIFAILICRRFKQESYYYENEKYYSTPPPGDLEPGGWDVGRGEDSQHAIPVHLFPKHVLDLHMNGEVGFAKEYEEIRAASCLDEFAAQESQKPDNQDQNRYPNIIAFDHTRVRLKTLGRDNKEKEEYLNANYVDGFRRPRAFIATQGPMASSTALFWRMVWEQNVSVIVMITHLYEGGKLKCDQYWPEAEDGEEGGLASQLYGEVDVRTVREDTLAFYTLRTFAIRRRNIPAAATANGGTGTSSRKKKHAEQETERMVYQYHYTAWPDHGVPLHALPLVTFVRNSAAANPPTGAPIVVHCSAGVGRTGCYITIHAMLQQILARGDLDIFSYLQHIRGQRNGLVQTEEQYIFIHDALVEAIEAGETHITKSCLPKYIHGLQCIDVTDEKPQPHKVIEKQYKLVCAYHPGKTQYSTALKICNQSKNRCADLLPTDSHRVYLSPGSDMDGADYINASWLTGFYSRKGFIVSQHPLDSTVSALWQLVAEQEVMVMLILSNIDNEDYRPFWPLSYGSEIMWDAGYSQFNVSLIGMDDFTPRTIRLRLETGGVCREVAVVQASNWPAQCSPLSTVFDLIKLVDEESLRATGGRRDRPILVLDRNGGSQAGTFCSLMSMWHQLEFEGCVDVFQLARLYHYSRPGIWRSQEDYLFMYCALEAFITNNGTTIPSPVDLEQWRNGYQLNGCVRVSKVYTDSVGGRMSRLWESACMTDSLRIPPDGQESAGLLLEASSRQHSSFLG